MTPGVATNVEPVQMVFPLTVTASPAAGSGIETVPAVEVGTSTDRSNSVVERPAAPIVPAGVHVALRPRDVAGLRCDRPGGVAGADGLDAEGVLGQDLADSGTPTVGHAVGGAEDDAVAVKVSHVVPV